MTCVDCHDPHAPDNRARMDALDGPSGNRVCIRCHTKYDNVIALEAHAHHRAGGAGAVCMNCHMPRKNMSLDTRLTRYHRVGSPTDRARVEGDRPLECALCHRDQSVGSLVEKMEEWWHKSYDRPALVALYGTLEARPLLVALERGRAHEQAAALGVFRQWAAEGAAGQAAVRPLAPSLAAQLTHPYPLLRYYAARALEAALGEPSPVELHQDNDRIRAAAAAWLGRHGQSWRSDGGPRPDGGDGGTSGNNDD
jgi:predicted CXXCH cytochrome family protein